MKLLVTFTFDVVVGVVGVDDVVNWFVDDAVIHYVDDDACIDSDDQRGMSVKTWMMKVCPGGKPTMAPDRKSCVRCLKTLKIHRSNSFGMHRAQARVSQGQGRAEKGSRKAPPFRNPKMFTFDKET